LYKSFDKKRAMRVKYVRALEKFVKAAINILKRADFDFERFEERMKKNATALKKVEPVVLDSTYTKSLEDFANLVLQTVDTNKDNSEDKREILLKNANALEKLKANSSYKKEKHPKKIFEDGY